MDYLEVTVRYPGSVDPEILVARLAGLDFESFSESDGALQAYIRSDQYDAAVVERLLAELQDMYGISHETRKIPAQNWNALWESAYEPVTIGGKCRVRAPFHAPDPAFAYDLVIEPKMSFGTAHHETTTLMLEMMMDEDLAGKRVLDMGCGTAVLAILAFKMNASEVVAIDNDEWAYANAPENAAANGASAIRVIRGDATAIPPPGYGVIIANINRNVLLQDIPVYAGCLDDGGILFLSGFYETDLGMIREAAEKAGLHYSSHRMANNWTGAKFVK